MDINGRKASERANSQKRRRLNAATFTSTKQKNATSIKLKQATNRLLNRSITQFTNQLRIKRTSQHGRDNQHLNKLNPTETL
jgi:hypothetical protein